MTELYSVYQNTRQEKQEFLNRIIPLVLKDANIGNWRGRATYAKHWETEFKAMEQHFTNLGEEDLKLYKAMKRWHNEVVFRAKLFRASGANLIPWKTTLFVRVIRGPSTFRGRKRNTPEQ